MALCAIRYYFDTFFSGFRAETIFLDRPSRRFQAIETVARRKLYQLNQARSLRDLALPGNRLEALTKDRAGQHSIRLNDQFRVCFVWFEGDAFDVEIVDYP